MSKTPLENYTELMRSIRNRFDLIEVLRNSQSNEFSRSETAAFHGRKIIEGIAFACLVAIDNGLKFVPRDARGKWNAEEILKSLKAKNIQTLPSPSLIRNATETEQKDNNVKVVIEGIPERRLSHDELISIYQKLHRWAHEINPYVEVNQELFCSKYGTDLWEDLARLKLFITKHFTSISGEGFFCILWDDIDGLTKIGSASRIKNT